MSTSAITAVHPASQASQPPAQVAGKHQDDMEATALRGEFAEKEARKRENMMPLSREGF